MTAARCFFVAAEASGDLLAREVIEELRAQKAAVEIAGIGGNELAEIGISSPIDVAPLSVLGFFEGLKAYGDVVRLADEATEAILAFNPDVVILVDSWGFMLRVAQRLRHRAPDIRLVKLIGPQVWATRPGRARTLAATVDHLLCMHDIEVPFYTPYELPTTVVGNPALSRSTAGDGAAFRSANDIDRADDIVLVLPGSRRSEIERVAPALMEAARRLKDAESKRHIVIAPARSILPQFEEAFPNAREWAIVQEDPADRYDAMAAATLALACSGTVTTELAMQGTPMLVAYKTGWITWALARGFLYQKTHITLLNIISDDQEIVPEFVQSRQRGDLIAYEAERWLNDKSVLAAQHTAQGKALERMKVGGADAGAVAAKAILSEAEASIGARKR